MTVELVTIRQLQDEYVLCRTINHSWDDNPTGPINPDFALMGVAVQLLRCTRCGTTRTDYIGKDLRVFHRRYIYPPGYRTIPGQGTRPNLMGERMRRFRLGNSMLLHGTNGSRRR